METAAEHTAYGPTEQAMLAGKYMKVTGGAPQRGFFKQAKNASIHRSWNILCICIYVNTCACVCIIYMCKEIYIYICVCVRAYTGTTLTQRPAHVTSRTYSAASKFQAQYERSNEEGPQHYNTDKWTNKDASQDHPTTLK